jgi:glutathione S-transferase
LADGMLDAVVLSFVESLRKPERQSKGYIAHNRAAVARAVDALEKEAPLLADPNGPLDIGAITIGVALDFVEFHFKDYDWRPTHPALAGWFGAFRERPAMVATRPVNPCDAG